VLEIFIRPPDSQCYWEFFATPNQHQAVTFFLSSGRRLPGCLQKKGMDGYRITVELDGTLNNYADRDHGWKCIAAILLKELRKKCRLDFSATWLV